MEHIKTGQKYASSRDKHEMDLVIVGAGLTGLIMAKTYLEVNPTARLIILESVESIGGVWCKSRIYSELRTNNLVGTYESSDFPMVPKDFGISEGDAIPGHAVHEYLRRFAEEFDVARHIRFNSHVETVSKLDSGIWDLSFTEKTGGKCTHKSVTTKRLVTATGLTSQPYLPSLPGQEAFAAPIVHVKNLREHYSLVHGSKEVIVIGGAKSGWDSAFAFARAGVKVNWVIRASGHGPVWMAPPYVTPLKKRLEKLIGVRFMTWFNPSIWGAQDGFGWVRKLLHGTIIGRAIVNAFWKVLNDDLVSLNGYDSHPELKKLKPWTPAFWADTSLSILTYPDDFFEYVRNGTISVHIADIEHMSKGTVHLSSGEAVHGEAIICSTGWKPRPSIKFYPDGLERQLGLPQTSSDISSSEAARIRAADAIILERLPRLKEQPICVPGTEDFKVPREPIEKINPAQETPYQLYQFMVPPALINDRSFGFIGALLTVHTPLVAQAQALWLTAYFAGEEGSKGSLKKYNFNEVTEQAMLHSRYSKLRYPESAASYFPHLVFEGVPYIDMILRDLGLPHRRKRSLWSEIFDPYGPADYVGLVDEWRTKRGYCVGVPK